VPLQRTRAGLVAVHPRSVGSVGSGDPLAEGWECLRRGSWKRAKELFEASLEAQESAEAFEGLAWACFWLVDADALFHARAQAFRLFTARGDPYGAARAAMWIGSEHLEFKGNVAVANGWFRRARRLLASADASPEHGWLALHEGEAVLFGEHDTTRSQELAVTAAELGRSFGSAELEGVGMALEGLSLVTEGRVQEGMSLLDEAAVAAMAGGFRELWAVGWASCYLIYACERALDFDRADKWCREIEETSRRMGIDFAWALCRAHHASVLVWHGEWAEAEVELQEAERALERQRPPWMAEATVRLAELRRRQGRFNEAASLFQQVDGHPLATAGMAEQALERGEPARARRLAERLLRTIPVGARTERAPGLQLLVRSHAAAGDIDAAAEALLELEALVEAIGTLPLRASASRCAGVLDAVRGEHESARQRLEDAVGLFQRSGAPYESARARLDLADSLAAVGAAGEAAEQRAQAGEILRRLGVDRAQQPRPQGGDGHAPLTPREREVLALVAQGMSDRRMAEALTVSEHTVHRHVSNILTKLGCSSRAAAVARGVAFELIDPLRA
jgi:LuxR family transcriptional regulator, maltose regulon positive regulatory protein